MAVSAERTVWVKELFQNVDDKNTDAFVAFMSDNVLFRFGNAEAVQGKAAVDEGVRGFFDSIQSLRHEISDTWAQDDAVICQGTVTYTRHDTTTLTVPFANIFKLDAGLITDYLIYVDISELYPIE